MYRPVAVILAVLLTLGVLGIAIGIYLYLFIHRRRALALRAATARAQRSAAGLGLVGVCWSLRVFWCGSNVVFLAVLRNVAGAGGPHRSPFGFSSDVQTGVATVYVCDSGAFLTLVCPLTDMVSHWWAASSVTTGIPVELSCGSSIGDGASGHSGL